MANKRWVVLLTDLYGAVGGIPAFNRELIRALSSIARERSWILKVYVLNDRLPSERGESEDEGYEYHAFGGNRWSFVLEALLAARGADHIIFGHAHLSPLALAISGGQRWAMAHGIEVWEKMTWLRRLGLLRMDRLLCVSRYTRDRMVHEQAIDPGRVVLFPDTARSREGASAFPQEALGLGKAKVILAVTRLWPEERYKKIDLLIEAMPSVLRSVPEALLVIVGEGADRPRLERTVQESGLSGHVRFTGKIPDDRLSSFYDACDLFALPSLGEGFGIVFLEAMAHGKPCIGAQAGAVPEVIQDGRTGLLVRPDDAGALAEALIRLLQNEDLRQAMGQAGRRRFLSEFSFDRFKERLARLTEPPA